MHIYVCILGTTLPPKENGGSQQQSSPRAVASSNGGGGASAADVAWEAYKVQYQEWYICIYVYK
jgi:hypothetical protein